MSFWANLGLILFLAATQSLAQSTSRGPRMGPPSGEKFAPYRPGSKGGTPRVPDFGGEVPQNPEAIELVFKENDVTGDMPGSGVPVYRMDERSCVKKETSRMAVGTPIKLTEFKRCGGVLYYLYSTEKKNNKTEQRWVSGHYLEVKKR